MIDMDERIPGIILAIILTISLFISLYFLAIKKITIDSINTINPLELLKIFFSTNFILFLITISISFAIILLIAKIYNYKFASIFISAGMIIGPIIGLLIFNQFFLTPLLLIIIIGVIFSIKNLTKKEEELKYFKTLRSGINVTQKIILIFSIGLFLQLAIMNLDKQEFYETEFPKELVNLTVGNSKSIEETTKEPLIDLVILTQKQTMNTIINNNSYQSLKDKNDTDVQTFILTIDSINTQINSKEYKEVYEKEFGKNFQNMDFGQDIIKSSPLMKNLSKNAWLIYAISGLLSALFIGGLIVKNISSLIYTLIVTILNAIKKNNLN